MNTQMIVNPPAAATSSAGASQPKTTQAAATDKTSPSAKPAAEEAERVEEEEGEDATFGTALQTEVRRARTGTAGKTKAPRTGKGQWAATAALAKKSKAIGRTLRGISDLAIERPKAQAVTVRPALTELNAAGREFAGKVAEAVQADLAKADLGQTRQDATKGLADALALTDKADALRLTKPTARAKAPLVQAEAATDKAAKPDAGGKPAQDAEATNNGPAGPKTDEFAAALKAKVARQGGPATEEATRDGAAPQRLTAEATTAQDQAARVRTTAKLMMAGGSDAPARVAKVAEQMATMIREGTHRAQIELHPPDLGKVSLEIEVRGDQVAVKMVVDSAEAHQRLQSDAEALAESLREQGLDLTGMDVSVDRGDGGEDADDESAQAGSSGEGAFGGLMGEAPGSDTEMKAAARRWHSGDVDVKA